MKRSLAELLRRGPLPPRNWEQTSDGARPVPLRRQKLGTARLKANRGSERMHRALRSAFISAIEMMVLVIVATGFGALLWELYEGVSTGRAVIQAVIAAVAVMVWLTFTRERYKTDQRRQQAYEREQERRADTPEPPDRTARLDHQPPPSEAPTTEFQRDWDFHDRL